MEVIYNNIGQNIDLIGRVIEDSIILMELDIGLKPRANFKGIIIWNKITGIWTNIKSPKHYPFELESNYRCML